uniref:Uncharacterized protein n=1 Tax=Setaria viridis TaxID=4556 RepID=A0A4U6TK47_SETVI|nr:hypothetical protein SEVIR_8G189600v2 [Setaria viridis]
MGRRTEASCLRPNTPSLSGPRVWWRLPLQLPGRESPRAASASSSEHEDERGLAGGANWEHYPSFAPNPLASIPHPSPAVSRGTAVESRPDAGGTRQGRGQGAQAAAASRGSPRQESRLASHLKSGKLSKDSEESKPAKHSKEPKSSTDLKEPTPSKDSKKSEPSKDPKSPKYSEEQKKAAPKDPRKVSLNDSKELKKALKDSKKQESLKDPRNSWSSSFMIFEDENSY